MALAFRTETHAIASGTSTVTPSEPTGAAQNDILLYLHALDRGLGTFVSGPSGGWALLNTWTNTSSETRLYWIRRGSSAPGFTTTINANGFQEVSVTAWSGATTSGTPFGATTYNAATTRTNPDCPAVTTTAANSFVIAAALDWNGATTTWTGPSGYSTAFDGTGLTNSGVAVFYKAIAAASTLENPGAFSGAAFADEVAEATLELLVASGAANSATGSATSGSAGAGITASVGVGTAGSPTTLFSRPYLNVSAGNWLGSSGSQLANDIDEPTASDDEYIYDANTGVDGEYRLEPIPDAGTQSGLILHYRPETRWWDSTIVTTLLYGSTTISQWTDSLTANAGATTLDKTLTVAEIAAIRTASGSASIWTDLRLRHSATQ